MENEHLIALAETLGLAEDFRAQFGAEGAAAIIGRAYQTDASGALGFALAMSRELGRFLDDRAMKEQPPSQGELLSACEAISESFGLDPSIGVPLLGCVLDVFQASAKELSRGRSDGRMASTDGPPGAEPISASAEPAGGGAAPTS